MNRTPSAINNNNGVEGSSSVSGSSSGSDESDSFWREWFHSLKGNDIFCEVDKEFILDRFNLTGLNEIPFYGPALKLITDALEEDLPLNVRDGVEKSARHLYGMIHARFILTARGAHKMNLKLREGEFGKCPRVLCGGAKLLPVGLSDVPGYKCVKMYCAQCEDVYHPLRRYIGVDGAYFTTTFPHLLYQLYPSLLPKQAIEVYEPKIFGFRIHAIASEAKSQRALKAEQEQRLDSLELS